MEQDNCFIIQQILFNYHFQSSKNYGSMIATTYKSEKDNLWQITELRQNFKKSKLITVHSKDSFTNLLPYRAQVLCLYNFPWASEFEVSSCFACSGIFSVEFSLSKFHQLSGYPCKLKQILVNLLRALTLGKFLPECSNFRKNSAKTFQNGRLKSQSPQASWSAGDQGGNNAGSNGTRILIQNHGRSSPIFAVGMFQTEINVPCFFPVFMIPVKGPFDGWFRGH